MKKKINIMVFLLLFSLMPLLKVNASNEIRVTTETQFNDALKNKDITTIILDDDINTTDKINITREVTIDGNYHTLKYTGPKSKTEWNGIYILQVYKTNATIKNIKLTGGNAGLLINGGTVTFVGNIDVSGNGFGGIELSQGKGVTSTSELTFAEGSKIINSDDSKSKPTFWVPNDSKDAIIHMNGMTITIPKGEELVIDEFENLFEDLENPKTGSKEVLYFISGIISIFSIIFIIKKYLHKGFI